jgi:hypothetical protein
MYRSNLAFHKVIHPFDYDMRNNGRKYPVFCEISITDDGRLSITGVEGPTHGGNCVGGAGQIDMHFQHDNPAHDDKRGYLVPASALRFAPGWDAVTWLSLLEIWHDWHLNDMRSGCEHQRAMGWTYEDHHGVWVAEEIHSPEVDEYATGEVEIKMVYHEFEGEACPVCGYHIGSSWLKEELPVWVWKFLRALPDTDRTPAWV